MAGPKSSGSPSFRFRDWEDRESAERVGIDHRSNIVFGEAVHPLDDLYGLAGVDARDRYVARLEEEDDFVRGRLAAQQGDQRVRVE